MMLFYVYMIGVLIAFILGIVIYITEEDKEDAQIGMLAPMALLSWITVFLILYKRLLA